MPAFQLAYDMKADGIETDVQLTKDGIPILIHDETLKRTAGVAGFIKDYTLAEIQQYDAGKYFSKKFTGTALITLDELLKWISGKSLYLNLELKNNKIDYKDIEIKVLHALEKYKLKDRTIISSFNQSSVKRMRQLDKNIDIALLRSKKHKNLVQYAVELGASSLHINYRLLNQALIEQCKAQHLPLRVYTVNRRTSIFNCLKQQCHGLFTDIPDKAIKLRNRYENK